MTSEDAQQIAEAFMIMFDLGGLMTISVAVFSYLLGATNPWLDRWLESRIPARLLSKAQKNES